MARAEEDPGVEGAPEWITTFVDMISLLVTFFILLFTFSSMEDYSRFRFPQNILGGRSPRDARGESSPIESPRDDLMSAMHPTKGAPVPHTRPPESLDRQAAEMGQKLRENEVEIDLSSTRDEIVVHFDESASFGPGETAINPVLRRNLAQLASVLRHYPNSIVIEGHTDTGFKPSPRYPTAEALSCARAVEAARALLAAGNLRPERVRIAGLGDSRPLNQNATATERTRNRRVDVRILAPELGSRTGGF